MTCRISRVEIQNFRSLANVAIDIGPVNILFGPNGAGKSTFLDTIWFFRDCAIRGVELASSARSHGIGILWDRAADDDQLAISLATDRVKYSLRFGLSSGRIEPFVGEKLLSLTDNLVLIDRAVGADAATLYHANVQQSVPIRLREPEKLSMGLYLDFNQSNSEAADLDRLMHLVRLYHSRFFFLHRLKTRGSEAGPETHLFGSGDNAWSVLRNLHDRRNLDDRYETIMMFMRRAFPSFDEIALEQTGPNSVYASFLESGRRKPVKASGVSDGHLQMLLLLTALFSEGNARSAVLLFDEPEISLHPWALSILAEAINLAANDWNKQVIVATHSPVLISQFETDQIIAAEVVEGETKLKRLSNFANIANLLDQYAAGSLYMANTIASQGQQAIVEEEDDNRS